MAKEQSDRNPYGLKVAPRDVAKALATLAEYVDERAKVITDGKLKDVLAAARLMHALDTFTEEVQKLIKAPAELAYNHIRFTVLPNLMDDDGVTSIGVDGVGRVNLQDDIAVKVLDKDLLRDWLKEQGSEDIIKETVNAQTLAAFIRERMRTAAAEKRLAVLPADTIMTVKPLTRAVITKERP